MIQLSYIQRRINHCRGLHALVFQHVFLELGTISFTENGIYTPQNPKMTTQKQDRCIRCQNQSLPLQNQSVCPSEAKHLYSSAIHRLAIRIWRSGLLAELFKTTDSIWALQKNPVDYYTIAGFEKVLTDLILPGFFGWSSQSTGYLLTNQYNGTGYGFVSWLIWGSYRGYLHGYWLAVSCSLVHSQAPLVI